MHYPVAWYFFVVTNILMWAWGIADCVHVVTHPEGRSAFRIACRWIALLVLIDLMVFAFLV
jgi:hypothetical protein